MIRRVAYVRRNRCSTPASPLARALVILEQVLGVMYVAFLIARLANMYGREKRLS